MTFIQRILSSGDSRCEFHEPDSCAVIDCVTTEPVTDEEGNVIHPAGAVVWHSHLDASVHPEHRLNPDHPAEDHRGSKPVPVTKTDPCPECKEKLGQLL